MSQENTLQELTFVAEGNLNNKVSKTTASRYRAVKAGTGEKQVAAIAAGTDFMIGVLKNEPADTELAEVAVEGTTKARAGGVIAAWAFVKLDAAGKFVTGGGVSDVNFGIALEAAAADGDIFEMRILPSPYIS